MYANTQQKVTLVFVGLFCGKVLYPRSPKLVKSEVYGPSRVLHIWQNDIVRWNFTRLLFPHIVLRALTWQNSEIWKRNKRERSSQRRKALKAPLLFPVSFDLSASKMSVRVLNPNAEVLNKSAALHMTINAAKGLQDVLKSNLGPKGTIKM